MPTIKSYTDIEQSKKLAKILPIDSADMLFNVGAHKYADSIRVPLTKEHWEQMMPDINPCWSLAALFGVLPLVDFTTPQLIGTPKTLYRCMYNDDLKSHAYDNPVDACYELILRLHELKML